MACCRRLPALAAGLSLATSLLSGVADAAPGDKIELYSADLGSRLQAVIDLGTGQVLRQSAPMGVRSLTPTEWRQLIAKARTAVREGLKTRACALRDDQNWRLHILTIPTPPSADGASGLSVVVDGKGVSAPMEPACRNTAFDQLWSAASKAADPHEAATE